MWRLARIGLCLLLLAQLARAFKITSVSPNQTSHEGGTVRLRCQSDVHYEYCVWRHNSLICEFEWKSAYDKVLKQRCSPELSGRLRFVGEYYRHECEVELTGLRAGEDAGGWSCEMEDYVWGSLRGAIHKRSVYLQVTDRHDSDNIPVVIMPEPETTTAITATVAADPTTNSSIPATPTTTTESTTEHHSLDGDIFDKFKNVSNSNDSDSSDSSDNSNNNDPVWDQQHVDLSPRTMGEDDAVSTSEEDVSAGMSTTSLVGIVLLAFCSALTAAAAAVFLLYRRRRKALLEMDWAGTGAGRKDGQAAPPTRKVEMTNIIDDNDDNNDDDVSALEEEITNPATPIVRVEIDVDSQRMTYHGSRSVSYEAGDHGHDQHRPSSNKD